jgi:hypothetical protein
MEDGGGMGVFWVFGMSVVVSRMVVGSATVGIMVESVLDFLNNSFDRVV